MRVLIIGPDEKAAIAKVVAYAMEPSHFHKIGGPIPGDNPAFVADIPDGFRGVFTLTQHGGKLFRHLTVSVTGGKFPSPEACVLIAKEYGFTASDDELSIEKRIVQDGWQTGPGHKGEHCIVLVQPTTNAN